MHQKQPPAKTARSAWAMLAAALQAASDNRPNDRHVLLAMGW
jgi:hypothetical protein